MKNEEEEDDYMSNDFLNQIVDTRPGLVYNRSLARKYELEKKSKQKIEENNQKNIPTKELEKIKRDEALNKSTLNETNKGFNLMLKMGYQKGQALGNSAGSSTSLLSSKLTEPIKVEIKTDRSGLGQGEEKKRKLTEYLKVKETQSQTDTQIAEAYLDSKRQRFQIKKQRSNLFKCQKICYQLDSTKKELKVPILAKWYWPINIIRALNEKETQSILDPSNKINIETNIVEEENEEIETEIYQNVPKNKIDIKSIYNERLNLFLKEENKNQEEQIIEPNSNEEGEEDDEETQIFKSSCLNKENSDSEEVEEEFDQLSEEVIAKRVESILLYLRENYFYCVWCATRFESTEDLLSSCPGIAQNDHEDYD